VIVNRGFKAMLVTRIASDILRGDWYVHTGETIKFEKERDGHLHGADLVDGQNRLRAIVQAGMPTDVWIAVGVPRNAFVYLDSGERRTLKDVLHSSGENHPGILAAALTLLGKWDPTTSTTRLSGTTVSHAVARKILDADPSVRQSLERTHGLNLLGRGVGTFLHVIFSKKDAALADRFVSAMITGENLAASDPFYVLRELLVQNKGSRRKLITRDLIFFCIKAWNAARDGRDLKILRIRKGEEMEALK
jgi:hypothetical protein